MDVYDGRMNGCRGIYEWMNEGWMEKVTDNLVYISPPEFTYFRNINI